jgi:imidazolonepropionase-like amidohydrolase
VKGESSALIFCHARVITCNKREEVFPDGFVAIEGDKILDAGEMAKLSSHPHLAGETQIDLSAKTIIPGLVNAHIHFTMRRGLGHVTSHPDVATESFQAVRTCLNCLREGVTAARDTGHNDHVHMQLRDAVNSLILGPRMKVAGAAILMSWGHAYFMCQQVHTVDEAVAEIRRQVTFGADFIKLIASNEDVWQNKGTDLTVPWFDLKVLKACVETAHECGLKVTVHANGTETLKRVLQAGVDGIEHGIYLNRSQAKEMKERGVFLVPTMTGYRENADPKWGRGDLWTERYASLWSQHQISMVHALEEGVLIAAGTDTLGEVADEMELLTRLGMSSVDSLKAATLHGAKVLEMENEIGSLEPGKMADFVVLDRNPLEDIRGVRSICQVVKGGKVYRRDELDKFVPECKRFAPGW